MNKIKKIIKFTYMHPIWTMLIGMFISSFISYSNNKGYAGAFAFLIIYAFFVPFLRAARESEIRKQEYDYLAKKTAEEIAKQQLDLKSSCLDKEKE